VSRAPNGVGGYVAARAGHGGFGANGADLPIDHEHATEVAAPHGRPAPAVGWIVALEARDGAVWGRVSWTDEGRRAVAAREYRYISPVFHFDRESGEVLSLASAGLTNQPALRLPALARRQGDGGDPNRPPETEDPMIPSAICRALDLQEGAAEPLVLEAIQRLKTEKAAARAAAEAPPLDRFVPRADHDRARARIAELEAAEAARAAATVEAEVDAAVQAGKITPAGRDFYLAACRAEGGLERFRAFVASAPEMGGRAGGLDKAPGKGAGVLTEDEKAACRAVGWSEADFATWKEAS